MCGASAASEKDLIAAELIAQSLKLETLQRNVEALQKLNAMQHELLMATIEAFRCEMRVEFSVMRLNHRADIQSAVSPLRERAVRAELRLA